MAIEVQYRRGTTAQHAVFTGAAGELTIDTTLNTAVIHDGATVGGFPLLGQSTGLGYFQGARATAAPNDSIFNHALSPVGSGSSIGVSLVPVGSGYLSAAIPDSTATGGNPRGAYSVDWQPLRSNPGEVASGLYSTIGGGFGNEASGQGASVGGGQQGIASGPFARVGGGVGNWATQARTTVGGGAGNLATGSSSTIGGGESNLADGVFGTIPGGYYGTTRGLYGRYSYASGRFNIAGDAQIGGHVLRIQTTDTTTTSLTADGAAASTTNVPVLPNSHAYTVTATVTARNATTGDAASWILKGLVQRGSGAATTTFVDSHALETIAVSSGAATWSVGLAANTTRGSAEVLVSGAAATTIRWDCELNSVEIG